MLTKNCLWCNSNKINKKCKRKDSVNILQCQECGLLMVDEMPEESVKLYTDKYFEKETDNKNIGYNSYFSNPVANLLGKYALVKLFTENRFGKYLDLGCADGSLMELFKSYGFTEVYGLDISSDAIAIAKNKGLNAAVSNLNNFLFPDNNVDFISAFDLFEHLDHPRNTLIEIKRVMKDSGIFVFSTLHVDTINDDDYWFNNSLEHFIYYNKNILMNLFEDVFGSGNVFMIVVNINGISEIIGIAKKQNISDTEKKMMQTISDGELLGDYDKDALLSLVYNQLGMFKESKNAINSLSMDENGNRILFLNFMYHFYRGEFYEAIKLVEKKNINIEIMEGVFWQAYSYVLNYFRKMSQSEKYTFKLYDLAKKQERTVASMEQELSLMKSSKFWKLRNFYIYVKNLCKGGKILRLVRTSFLILRRDGISVFFVRLSKASKELFIARKLFNSRRVVEKKYQDRWNSDKPLVSIIIPCYNYGKFVIEAIESAVSQTFQSIEIIVINDGSTDKDTIDVLNNLNYPKVRVVHQENQGLAQTRNNGALLSKGKYICFLDADDMMMPTYIEKALIILEADGNLGCAYSWLQCFGDNESIWRTQDFDSFVIRNSNIASSHSVIRKSAWDKVFELNNCGFLTKYNGYFEDWVFWIDMIRTGLGGRVIKECLIRYRIHKNSLSATHKPGFSKKLSELKTDRRDFFENNKLADELQEKIYNQIKILNPFENIIEAEFIKSNKSILFIVPWLTCGGVESVLLEKIKGLKFNGFQITIITTEESDNDWEWKFLEVTPFIYHLPNYLDRSDYNKFIFSFINGRNITEVCGVHSNFFYQIAGDMVRRFPKINISDVLHNDSKLGYYESAVKYDKYIKTHIVISNRIKKVIENCGVKREKIKVVYNGIDTFDRFNPRECVKEKTKMNVLFLGRFSPEKRPLDFLKVAKEFANDKDIQFFMGGDGILKKEIDLFIKRNRLKNVKLLGFVKPESTLINSDILVMTSEVEGFPMAALEAMSMKNVVISTNVGEIDKIVLNNKNGFVISEVGGIKAIKEKISYFQNNRNALREMQDSARIHVLENYDVKYMTKGYLEIFSNKK